MSTFAEAREHFEPLCEVYVGETPQGHERLFIGEILTADRIDGCSSLGQQIPVSSRPAEELLKWIWTYPAELNRTMETELAESLGGTVDIGEWYPAIPEEREVITR